MIVSVANRALKAHIVDPLYPSMVVDPLLTEVLANDMIDTCVFGSCTYCIVFGYPGSDDAPFWRLRKPQKI